MARVEVPVQTPLLFHTRRTDFAPPLSEMGKSDPQTVIEFESRELVWHAPTMSEPFGDETPYEYAPTVTLMQEPGDDDGALFGLILRFLSALSFYHEVGAWVHNYGGGGVTDPLHRAVSRNRRALIVGGYIVPAPRRIDVTPDPRLHLALAAYREGVSANSPYLGFVAYWNVIEAAHGGDGAAIDSFLKAETPATLDDVNAYVQSVLTLPPGQQPPADIATYLREHGRDAIAHIVRDRPPWTEINPDDPHDRHRMDADTWLLRALARRAILTHWPDPVRVTPHAL